MRGNLQRDLTECIQGNGINESDISADGAAAVSQLP